MLITEFSIVDSSEIEMSLEFHEKSRIMFQVQIVLLLIPKGTCSPTFIQNFNWSTPSPCKYTSTYKRTNRITISCTHNIVKDFKLGFLKAKLYPSLQNGKNYTFSLTLTYFTAGF